MLSPYPGSRGAAANGIGPISLILCAKPFDENRAKPYLRAHVSDHAAKQATSTSSQGGCPAPRGWIAGDCKVYVTDLAQIQTQHGPGPVGSSPAGFFFAPF